MQIQDDTPFKILVLGDFCGQVNQRKTTPLARRRPIRIDRDNFDRVMQQLEVGLNDLQFASQEHPAALRFREIDDFHPDQLLSQCDFFSSLSSLRDRLLDDGTYREAAQEVLSWSGAPIQSQEHEGPAPVSAKEEPAPVAPPPSGTGSLLDQMLDDPIQPADTDDQWTQLVREIALPYCLPDANPRQAELLGCVDSATRVGLRALLQHPRFRKLEATWRALHLLVHRLETNTQLQISILDVSEQELLQDSTCTNVAESGLHRILVEQTIEIEGSDPWSLIVGDFLVGDHHDKLLAFLGAVASAAGAPLLTAADDQLVGFAGDREFPEIAPSALQESDAWAGLQASPEASSIALVWPRFLLRLPYGQETNPLETLDFDEIPADENQAAFASQLLWGNGSYLCALLLGESFTQAQWQMAPGDVTEIRRLPVWIFQQNGESEVHPCGEYLLSERVIAQVRAKGVMTLTSIRDQDSVRISKFHSLNGQQLSGRWTR